MADPRFYDNRGPFVLGELCARASLVCPATAAPNAEVFDVAGLAQAGPSHLTFFDSTRAQAGFQRTRAGWCLIGQKMHVAGPAGTVVIPCVSVGHAFTAIASLFYP